MRRAFKTFWESQTYTRFFYHYLQNRPSFQAAIYWVAGFSAGLVVVWYVGLFHALESEAKILCEWHPLLFFIVAPAAGATSLLLLKNMPQASGSGIPQTMAAVELATRNSPAVYDFIGVRPTLYKILSSLLFVLGGGALGPEGPAVQIASAIFLRLGRPFKRIWADMTIDSLVIAGGAAGIAAAFNTPLGGIVFALEELAQQHFKRVKTFLIASVIVAGMVAQWVTGPYLYFGYPAFRPLAPNTYVWMLALGVVGGAVGAAQGQFLFWVSVRLEQANFIKRMCLAAAACFGAAVLGYAYSPHLLGSGKDAIVRLLFEDHYEIPWFFMFFRIVAPMACFASGAAGGMLVPALTLGAMLGAKMAATFGLVNGNLLIFLGMIALLTGLTHAPFCAFVTVLEMTDRHAAIFPMMLVALVASAASRLVASESYYWKRRDRFIQKWELPSPPARPTLSPKEQEREQNPPPLESR